MIRVEYTDGDERELKPERFILADRTLEVEAILDRWFGDTYTYFKVRADDGHTYILKHNRTTDAWELLYSETDLPEPPEPTWPFTRSTDPRPS